MVALGIGLAAWTGGRQVLGGTALALGMANMPATSVGVALALGDWGLRHPRLRAALPLVLFALLWFGENWLRRGHPLHTGYENNAGYRTLLPYSGKPGFSYPLPLGLLQPPAVDGQGAALFAPGLFLCFPAARRALRPVRPFQRASLLVVAGLLLVYGQWWAWYGGYSWGPRFLVFAAIPAALRLAAECTYPPRRVLPLLAVLGALLLSLWGGFDGAMLRFWKQEVCTSNGYAVEAFCWDVPEFSVLFTPFIWRPLLEPGAWLLLAYELVLAVRLGPYRRRRSAAGWQQSGRAACRPGTQAVNPLAQEASKDGPADCSGHSGTQHRLLVGVALPVFLSGVSYPGPADRRGALGAPARVRVLRVGSVRSFRSSPWWGAPHPGARRGGRCGRARRTGARWSLARWPWSRCSRSPPAQSRP